MKRLISLMMTLTIFVSTSAFASNSSIGRFARQYHIDTRIKNISAETAMQKLTHSLLENHTTQAEIFDYLKTNLNSQQFSDFKGAIALGKKDIRNLKSLSQSDLQFIIEEVLTASSSNYGANYAGCTAVVSVGVVAVIVGVILGTYAYDQYGAFGGRAVSFRDRERAKKYAIVASIIGIAGIIATSSITVC